MSGSITNKDNIRYASDFSKEATGRRQINVKMVQNVLLIWLNKNIDEEHNANSRYTLSHLRRIANNINTFTDEQECIHFLETNSKEKVCIIISGSLGQHIVPRIHNMLQVDSIFIFCGQKHYHEQWAKEWFKIKGVFTEIAPICDALKETAHQCEQNMMSISIMATNDNAMNKKLDQLDPSFMYTQIFIEILSSIKFEEKHIKQFIDYCQDVFAGNEEELLNVNKFKQKYCNQNAIWWYTCDSFLYSMLNHAIRTLDGDIILKMGFFINDLHRHIDQLHKEQYGTNYNDTTFTVYRGQSLSKVDFDKLKETKGGLMSFNNFLSTSKNRNISLRYAQGALKNSDLVGILFVMTINPSIPSTPFASIHAASKFPSEAEVLFSMHTVFRIFDIKPLDNNTRLFQVDLILTSDNDKDLSVLTHRIREETKGSTGWNQLGELLIKIGQPKKAQEIYEVLLNQTSDEREKGNIYKELVRIKCMEGEYQKAIAFYEKSLNIYKTVLPSNHLELGKLYNHIGTVYDEMGEYSKALSYYEKTLEMNKKLLPANHCDLAKSYNNIGSVYSNMGQYSKALSSHEKALEIKQQSLPTNHPSLASTYNNIGLVYHNMGEYSKALSYYEKTLEISQKSLPANHPDLAKPYNNIGLVYMNMGEYSKALSYYEKELEISQKTLPANHTDLAKSYNNIGLVYDEMGEYSKADSSYREALEIWQQPLPSNQRDLAKTYISLGLVYYSMDEYLNAIKFYEKALEIQQQSLPATHPSLAKSYNNIGLVYSNMGEHSKALSSYGKALEIRQQLLPANHPDLAKSYNNIGLVYEEIDEYSKAMTFYEKALEVRQQSLPANHPDLANSYGHIGNAYYKSGEYSKALIFCERAVNIAQCSLPSNHSHLEWYRNILDLVKQESVMA